MCGIVGCVARSHAIFLDDFLNKSTSALHHRGPDSEGRWLDLSTGVGFGHTRLSIQDISPAGNQPMLSHCGRYVISFNGEIYNHLDLRQDLAGQIDRWDGGSDTETLLACIATWGLEKALGQIIGMFAFALWDKRTEQLSIVRDRMGEKPLYYGQVGDDFVFASEVHALRHHPAWEGAINRNAISGLLRSNYIPSPLSIFQNINKLAPGTFLTFDRSTNSQSVQTYWSATDAAEKSYIPRSTPYADGECLDELDRIFNKAVAGQMLSDVPLGAFLSGGIDSTAMVATMQAVSSTPIKTFTIGFNEKNYNEAKHAKMVANHLGTDHTELYVSSNEVLDIIPKLSELYTEPFADSSQIPTYLVSSLAKQSVKVALSGDGGDEVFGGYNRYLAMSSYWPRLKRIPISIRRLVSTCLTKLPSSTIDSLALRIGESLCPRYQISNASDKVRKIADVLRIDSSDALYQILVSQWQHPDLVVKGLEACAPYETTLQLDSIANEVERMMLSDQLTYLPNDILVKVDRAAMGTSLETRTPFLDHRLVEFSWRLPLHMKIRNGRGKWLLRQLVYKHVPQKLVDRPKAGFAMPIGIWLRGPLREWAEDLLNERRLTEEGFFDPAPIRKKWQEHLSGKSNWHQHLWSILMFQSWLKSQR